MKKIIFSFFLLITLSSYGQSEAVWDQGVPLCPDDKYISGLISKLGDDKPLSELDSISNFSNAKAFREIGFAFYDKGLYDEADWYFRRAKNYKEKVEIEKINPPKEEPKLSKEELENVKKDLNFLGSLPSSYDNLSKSEMGRLTEMIDKKIQDLTHQRDSIVKSKNPNKDLVDSKNNTISSLNKEKEVINLTIEKGDLKEETKGLKIEKEDLKKYLWWSFIGISVLILAILVLIQRKTIKIKDEEIDNQLRDINKKNKYLEYSARIIRHDMHSGINTYIPRGISSLEKRISPEDIENLKISSPIKMIKDGLSHTQKVYKRVYEFTNLVKQQVVLDKIKVNTKTLLEDYFSNTSYKNNIEIGDLLNLEVNDILFCNAIDNLVKNGLQYNDNKTKEIKIYMQEDFLVIEDNGRGLSQEELEKITGKYVERKGNSEMGLGLSISKTILEEHGFTMESEKIKTGTKIKIKTKKQND